MREASQAQKASISPAAVQGRHASLGLLPEPAVLAIHRLVNDASRLTERSVRSVADGPLGEERYVELVAVVAIMTFLSSLTVGAVMLVRSAASEWQSDVSREVTIQVRPSAGRDIEADVGQAADIAGRFRGIAGVRPYSKEESARLLEPWLGSGLSLDDLPVPRMIVVRLVADASPDLAQLRRTLTASVPGAILDDHRAWTERMRTMARTSEIGGIGILLLMLIATVLSVTFATRGAMATNRPIVERVQEASFRQAALYGVGPEVDHEEIVRAMMVVRANSMVHNAPSPALAQMIVEILLGEKGRAVEPLQLLARGVAFPVGPGHREQLERPHGARAGIDHQLVPLHGERHGRNQQREAHAPGDDVAHVHVNCGKSRAVKCRRHFDLTVHALLAQNRHAGAHAGGYQGRADVL